MLSHWKIKKPSDYLAFFSFSLRHKLIATSINPINHAIFCNNHGILNNSPPPTIPTMNSIIPTTTNSVFIVFISPPQPETQNNKLVNKSSDYFLFFKNLFPKIYANIVITINMINAKLIGKSIPVLKRNMLIKSNKIHKVKRTAKASSGVEGIGLSTIISQNESCLDGINFFGGCSIGK